MNRAAVSLRRAVKALTRRPAYVVTVVLSLAVAMALNALAFNLVSALFLRPLPVPNQASLVALASRDQGDARFLPLSYPSLQDVQAAARSLRTLAAYQYSEMSLEGDPPQAIVGQIVTGSFFQLLGVQAQIGRVLGPADDSPASPQPVMVISDALWKQRFGEDPAILGKSARVDGKPFMIVGVAPAGFSGTRRQIDAQVWIPLHAAGAVWPFMDRLNSRDWRLLRVLARLAPGISPDKAAAEVAAIGARLAHEYPAANEGQSLAVISFADEAIGPNSRIYLTRAATGLLTLVLLLLVAAGVNSANFLLTGLFARAGEIRLRLALGATRGQILRQFALESGLLIAASLSLALLLALWGRWTLMSLTLGLGVSGTWSSAVDWRTAAWAAGTALAVGLASVVPISRATMWSSLVPGIGEATRVGTSLHRQRLRSALFAFQVSFTTAFLAAAGWLMAGVAQARQIDPGFATTGLHLLSFDLQSAGFHDSEEQAFCSRARAAISALPDVESVDLADQKPFIPPSLLRKVAPLGSDREGALVPVKSVTGGYFHTLGISLVSGRSFRDGNGDDSSVAIVNQELARQLWPGLDPVGRQIRLDKALSPITVIGVARNAREASLTESPAPLVYQPFPHRQGTAVTLYIRTRQSSSGIARDAVLTFRRLSNRIPVEATDADALVEKAIWAPLLAQHLFLIIGLITLLISTVGTHVLASLYAEMRRRDLAIHITLGARSTDLLRLIGRHQGIATGVGLLGSLPIAFAIARLLGKITESLDPSAGVFASAALLVVLSLLTAIALVSARVLRASLSSSLGRQ
jgi:predicted permease